MYTRDDPIGWIESRGFKKTFSMDVEIEFIGVWYARIFLPAGRFFGLIHL